MAQNEGFVFVSDLYENAISVIDKSSLKTVKKIQTDSWNEELLFVNGQLWITQTSKSEVLIMDVSTFQFVDTIYTTREPFAIKKDLNNKVWILCNGGLMEGKTPYLYQIDVNSKEKIDSLNLSSLAAIPSKLEVYENEIYVLAKNVYQLNNGSMNQLISGSGKTFYSLAVNKDYIFATDAKDYVRNGVLYRYDKKKLDHVQSTETGIIPGFIYFGE